MARLFERLRRTFAAAWGPTAATLCARLLIAALWAGTFALPELASPGDKPVEGLGAPAIVA